MARIFYLHWNQAEAEERVAALEAAGHEVQPHWSTEAKVNLKEPLPDALVLSLDRLPSHGRSVAEWFWELKKRQGIPIVFAGGQAEKVAVTREKFPRAIYCGGDEVVEVLSGLFKPARTKGSRGS